MALPIANVAKYELTLPSQQKTISFRPFLVKEANTEEMYFR